MKCIKGFLQSIDIFGVSFSFKNKKNEKYNTSLGGFIFLLFIIVALMFGIYVFIPFYNRKNFSIIYYSMNMPETDTIKLSESKASFAIGLECPFEEKTQVSGKDLFDLQFSYIVYTTDHEGKKNKAKNSLSFHPCTYADFYNDFNDSFDFAGLNEFECLDKKNNSLQGIYANKVFSYYEFSVVSKNDSVELFQKIERYLTEQDCKLEIFYTDVTIDFDSYKEPIKPFINSVFIQLNPTLFLKMNVFFKNQYFNDDDNLLLEIDEEGKTTTHTLFSRIEEYSLYKGLNRGEALPKDNIKYANIYIRADTSKAIIKRKYQKVMEFYADSSSLLLTLFDVLYLVFCFFNRFYAYHSLSKQIFFFKEVENKHFDINRKSNQIKNLTKTLDPLVEKKIILLSINNNKTQSPRINNNINNIDNKEKKIRNQGSLSKKDEIYKLYNVRRQSPRINNNINNINNKKKKIQIQEVLSTNDEIYKPDDVKKFPNRNMRNKMNIKIKFAKDKDNDKNNKNLNTFQSTKRSVISRSEIQKVKIPTMSIKGSKEIEYKKLERITFNYNILEILWFYLGTCCMTHKLKSKSNLTQKSNNILDNKLEISLYIKNTLLIDILNQALINDNMKSMTKFISRPIISLNKSSEINMSQFYKHYELTDFDDLYEDVLEMSKKPKLMQTEQKIISLVYNNLKEMD